MPVSRRDFLCSGVPLAFVLAGDAPPRLRRADCFLGMHFDLHPNKTDRALGRDVTPAMVERFLTRVKPDYVQYDCKGHVGYLGYPSRLGTSARGIVKDSLEIWRSATARRGVGLFIHFSGVWDSLAVERHPEWARVRPDGAPDARLTSTFGPYVDELMIPELKEAAGKYNLDGAWVDGECWAIAPDYSAVAALAFRKKTGIPDPPKGPEDRGWLEFLEFNREQFRRYVKHYVDALHSFRPRFQVASNWLYSTYVPERPELPVDFLSGDYLGNASISRARLEARYLGQTGKPWDLMAWGFQSARQNEVGPNHKSPVQLEQEASVVLAQGGGFQIYYQPTRAGKIDDRHIEVMGKVAEFCRARQSLSHKTESVPQVGVLFSKNSLYRTANKLFGGWGRSENPARGLLDALVENQYSVDVIPDWKLEESAGAYPLIVAPDWPDIGGEAQKILSAHVRQGGKVVVAGAENAALFAKELGVRLAGAPSLQTTYVLGGEVFGNARGVWQEVEAVEAQVIEERFPTYDSTRDGKCAATVNRFGGGAIAGIYGPIGAVFAATHAPAIRRFVKRVMERLFQPAVEVEGPPTVEVSLRKKNGKLLVHLGNCTAMQVAADYAAMDFVPPVGPLRVTLKLPAKPRRVTLEPEGQPLRGEWRNGAWSGTIARLDIHAILAFEV